MPNSSKCNIPAGLVFEGPGSQAGSIQNGGQQIRVNLCKEESVVKTALEWIADTENSPIGVVTLAALAEEYDLTLSPISTCFETVLVGLDYDFDNSGCLAICDLLFQSRNWQIITTASREPTYRYSTSAETRTIPDHPDYPPQGSGHLEDERKTFPCFRFNWTCQQLRTGTPTWNDLCDTLATIDAPQGLPGAPASEFILSNLSGQISGGSHNQTRTWTSKCKVPDYTWLADDANLRVPGPAGPPAP